MAVRPYCAERLKLTKSTHQAVVLGDLVGDDAAPYLNDPVSSILRTDGELASADEVPRPYTDPILHSTRPYRDLVGRLVQSNHVIFSLVRRATVGVSTAANKLEEQGVEWRRLIFDCRQVN